MAKAVAEMSLAELERALESKRSKVDELLQRREKLQKELEALDEKIRSLAGGGKIEGSVRRRRRRAKNEKSLKEHVVECLSRNKKGLALPDLHDKVLEAGYKTHSRNFRNVLYQCLYNLPEVKHDPSTGRYVMQG